jgi:DNA-binding CsgD family transcriptional regulator
MLLPGVFCLVVSLAISLGLPLFQRSTIGDATLSLFPVPPAPLSLIAALLAGVGSALLASAWAHAFARADNAFDRDALLANTAIAFVLASMLDIALELLIPVAKPTVVAVLLMLLSALPLELALSRGSRGAARPAAIPDEPCSQDVLSRTQAFRTFLVAAWKPFVGMTLCWAIFACSWGTALGTGFSSGSFAKNIGPQIGSLLAGIAMLSLLLLPARRQQAPGLLPRFLPVSATALLLLSWFLALIGPALSGVGQVLVGIAFGLLTILTWTELSNQAAQTRATDLIFGKAGALLLATMLALAALAWLLKDAAEFVSPILMLSYLVVVNLNFKTTDFPVERDRAALTGELDEQLAQLADTCRLSPREREILGYLANGLSAPYIAEALFISHNSVKTHTRHIYRKVGIHKRDELIALVNALKNGDSHEQSSGEPEEGSTTAGGD